MINIKKLISISLVCIYVHSYCADLSKVILYTDKPVQPGQVRVISIDTDRFPFFKIYKTPLYKEEQLSLDVVKILQDVDSLLLANNSIQESFKIGTYIWPNALDSMFSDYSLTTLAGIISQADYINRPDLVQIIGYQYARQLMHNPIKATKELAFGPNVDPTIDAALAKIIIDHALIKKASYITNPISYNFHEEASIYKHYHTSTEIDEYAYLCPTVSERCCVSIFTSSLFDRSRIITTIRQEDKKGHIQKEYKIPSAFNLWPGGGGAYKIIAYDLSYDLDDQQRVAIDNNNGRSFFNLKGIKNYLTTTSIDLGAEINAQEAKVIFEPHKHTFFLKFKNNIYQGDADTKQIDMNNPINSTAITDPWIKKYLSDDNAMHHSCPAVSYAQAQKEPYFNTRCLHALEFEAAQQKALKGQLHRIYGVPIKEIVQCACDPDHDMHYYLTQAEHGLPSQDPERKFFNLTNVSFKPDSRMQQMLQFMNALKDKKDPNTQLYPNALYIYHAYTNNWPSASVLRQKMGILLDQLVSDDLKQVIEPLQQPAYTRAWQSIYQRIKPYMNNIRTFGYVSATFGLTAIGYALVKKLPYQYRELEFPISGLTVGVFALMYHYAIKHKTFER